MITFKSESLFLKLHFILSVKDGKFFLNLPTGIVRAVHMVVPPTLAPSPVGAISNTFDLSADTFSYDKTFVNTRYITFMKNGFPHPALCVKIYATILFLIYAILISFRQSVLPNLKYY